MFNKDLLLAMITYSMIILMAIVACAVSLCVMEKAFELCRVLINLI